MDYTLARAVLKDLKEATLRSERHRRRRFWLRRAGALAILLLGGGVVWVLVVFLGRFP